jgi:hypothetical protein
LFAFLFLSLEEPNLKFVEVQVIKFSTSYSSVLLKNMLVFNVTRFGVYGLLFICLLVPEMVSGIPGLEQSAHLSFQVAGTPGMHRRTQKYMASVLEQHTLKGTENH